MKPGDRLFLAQVATGQELLTPFEGAEIYASSLLVGDTIVDETDECIIGKFRHLLPAILRSRGMDLEPTPTPGTWVVAAYAAPVVAPKPWAPLQRERAVA